MIEEILTDHPEHKVSAPAGELLKFGVQALLSARPFHNQLGKAKDGWVFHSGVEKTHRDNTRINILYNSEIFKGDFTFNYKCRHGGNVYFPIFLSNTVNKKKGRRIMKMNYGNVFK